MAIYDIIGINSYAEAVLAWERIKPWRGESEHAERTLDPHRRSRNWTIRKLPDESIACKLYRTDVVVYRPNGEVTITLWRSTSTDDFARRVGPAGLSCYFNSNPSMFVIGTLDLGRNRRAYQAGQTTTFVPDQEHQRPPKQIVPWQDCKLSRKRGNKVLKDTRYAEFEPWAKAARAMTEGEKVCPRHVSMPPTLEILAAGPTRWEELLWCDFEDLRTRLYKWFECIARTPRDWVPFGEARNVCARMRKWRKG